MSMPRDIAEDAWKRIAVGVLELKGTRIRVRLVPSDYPFQIFLGDRKAPLGYRARHTTLKDAKQTAVEFRDDLLEMGLDPSDLPAGRRRR